MINSDVINRDSPLISAPVFPNQRAPRRKIRKNDMRKQVLIVEDDVTTQTIVKMVFQKLRAQPTVVDNVSDAKENMLTNKYVLVILDMNFYNDGSPEKTIESMAGKRLLLELAEVSKKENFPKIIAHTAYYKSDADPESQLLRNELLSLGCIAVTGKIQPPFNPPKIWREGLQHSRAL